MDAVGRVLAERERESFPWATGASLAILLHAGIAAGFLASALARPVRFVPPRAVKIRVLSAGTLKGGAAVSVPSPEPEKPRIVKAEENQTPPPPSEKATLLPAKEEKEKPPVERSAAQEPKGKAEMSPASSPDTRAGQGGPVGAGGNVGIGGATFDQPDFNYSYYIERMLLAIGMNWFKPAQSVPNSPIVRFRIERDGSITDPVIERSSGLPFVDRAALRAVLASSPLPPLPAEFGGDHLGVHLIFE